MSKPLDIAVVKEFPVQSDQNGPVPIKNLDLAESDPGTDCDVMPPFVLEA